MTASQTAAALSVGDHHDEIVSPHVADETLGSAMLLYRAIDQVAGDPQQFASLGITVVIAERLEVVQIRIAKRKRRAALQPLIEDPLYGDSSRVAG